MDVSKDSLTANGATIVVPLLGLAIAGLRDWGGGALIACYAFGFAGILYCAWRAACGSQRQLVWTPITGILLCAVLTVAGESNSPVASVLFQLVIAVALGVPVMAVGLEGLNPILIMVVGLVIGWIGFVLSGLVLSHNVPVFNLFVPFDRIFSIDPLNIGFFNIDSVGASEFKRGIFWVLFLMQTVVVAAWDALLIAVCVGLVGAVVSLLVRTVRR